MKIANKNYKKMFHNNGFTVLEFIVYFAITIVILGIIVNISINIFVGKEKIRAWQEVSRSGRNAIDIISDAVSEAEEVEGVQ